MTRTFLKEQLLAQEVIDNAIEDIIVDTSRWSVRHEIVFAFGDKHFKTNYSVGATEQQDESPWEYESVIRCTEVELKEVVVKQWVPTER